MHAAHSSKCWDYLILTASHSRQAAAYESQLKRRMETQALRSVREAFVVADLEGKRIGSGGSTLQCLAEVVNRERHKNGLLRATPLEILKRLRILIVHAGGDSRRLPAYGPCGKIFVPVPGGCSNPCGATLFDRLVPAFLELPSGAEGAGQVVVSAGDALNQFDASAVDFTAAGITALGCYSPPQEAARHGVFCIDRRGAIRLFLQKPSLEEQAAYGAINPAGETVLDIGVMSFDAAAAVRMLEAFGLETTSTNGELKFSAEARQNLLTLGVDLYREICCAMGSEATLEHYVRSARASGSPWSDDLFRRIFPALRAIPFQAQIVPKCRFLHFGSSRQLISSGLALAAQDRGAPPESTVLAMNNEVESGNIRGSESWVEGCRVRAPLTLGGWNLVVGVDVDEPLWLPRGACLDVLKGRNRREAPVYFIRCYGIDDTFKDALHQGATLCGKDLRDWLASVGARSEDIWSESHSPEERNLWNARVFPAEPDSAGYRRWLWMYDPHAASAEQKRAYLNADRYSAAEMAWLADQEDFHLRRDAILAAQRRKPY